MKDPLTATSVTDGTRCNIKGQLSTSILVDLWGGNRVSVAMFVRIHIYLLSFLFITKAGTAAFIYKPYVHINLAFS